MRGPSLDKDGVCHYRRRIPDDVRAALKELEGAVGGKQDKREEKRRLGRDPILAAQRWQEHDKAVERRWAELRSRGTRPGLTMIEREALAGEIYRLWLKRFPTPDSSSALRAISLKREIEDFEVGTQKGLSSPRGLTHNDWRTVDEFEENTFGDDVDALLAKHGLMLSRVERLDVIAAAIRATK